MFHDNLLFSDEENEYLILHVMYSMIETHEHLIQWLHAFARVIIGLHFLKKSGHVFFDELQKEPDVKRFSDFSV